MTDTFAGHLVKSISVENLLGQRDAAMQRVRQAIAILKEAESIVDAAGIGDGSYRDFPYMLEGKDAHHRTRILDKGAEESIRKRMDAQAWQHLMNESGMRTLMDARAREDWDRRIVQCETPELTAENIRATFGDLYAARDDIFERGVIACFKSLNWDYKTNLPFAFGKRIVVTYLRNSITGGSGLSLGYPNIHRCEALDDLIRVHSVLDGKPEPDHRNGVYQLLYRAENRNERDIDTDYLHIRSFRNGNGHITFKRPELVQKMNRILAKHFPGALPHNPHAEAPV